MSTDTAEVVGGLEQPPALRTFKAFIDKMDFVAYWAVNLVMGAMTALVVTQVFFRYVLSSSIDAADELSRLFFVWSIFLAIPHGIKYGIHVGIDLLVRCMPARIQVVLFRVSCIASAILMIVTFTVCWTATMDKWPELMPTLPFTAAVFYIPVLICTGHSFLHLLALTWGGPNTWADENNFGEAEI